MLVSSRISKILVPCGAVIWAALTVVTTPTHGQSLPGPFVAIEGQRVFGGSDSDIGMVPDIAQTAFRPYSIDEGKGWGGALTLGYAWQNGWRAALRYRRLEADASGEQVQPGIIAFAPGVTITPGFLPPITGFLIPLAAPTTDVESDTNIIQLEVGRDVAVGPGWLHVFGGLTYASIEQDVSIFDTTCGCLPLSLHMGHDFHGVGPRIGLRGGVPISRGVSLVGGLSVAALFGKAEFSSRAGLPNILGLPLPFSSETYKDRDDRTVTAIDGEAGLAFAIGPGSLTIGYRVDAMFSALDTDQRVSGLVLALGFPKIGSRHDDFVEHGPFARFSLPLSGAAD